ncbi:hypothetical protein FRB97_006592 [Tulasnella sp. 331]|nr:hypothetical protein FRB97_006592 [Tulasnella sp. 331]
MPGDINQPTFYTRYHPFRYYRFSMTISYRVYMGAPTVGQVFQDIEETLSSDSGGDNMDLENNPNRGSWNVVETTTWDDGDEAALRTPEKAVVGITFEAPTPNGPEQDASRLTVLDRTRLEATSLLQPSFSRTRKSQSRSTSFLSGLREGGGGGGEEDVLPHETFVAASQRLSKLYENIIFPDLSVEEEGLNDGLNDVSRASSNESSVIGWDPTDPDNLRACVPSQLDFVATHDDSQLNANETFIRPSGETNLARSHISRTTSTGTQLESQISAFSEEPSYEEDSGGDSIGRFPTFHFSLHRLFPLSSLLKHTVSRREKNLVCLLVAVLEIEGPTTITTKAGVEIGLLKLIVGDELGAVAKIVCWRETAMKWGGGEDRMGEGAVRKGDVVFLEKDVAVTYTPSQPTSLSSSPNERSHMIICYRTLPVNAREDRQYRPDLRLGQSDAALRRVGTVVKWVEEVANIHR